MPPPSLPLQDTAADSSSSSRQAGLVEGKGFLRHKAARTAGSADHNGPCLLMICFGTQATHSSYVNLTHQAEAETASI
jgi:hypothetical protein